MSSSRWVLSCVITALYLRGGVASAVLIGPDPGTQNTTGAGVYGWDYVGTLNGGGGTGSATYLGNGWIITAAHNGPESNYTFTIHHDNGSTSVYTTDPSTEVLLKNANNSTADLAMVRLTSFPSAASLVPLTLSLSQQTGTAPLTMIGYGPTRTGTTTYNGVNGYTFSTTGPYTTKRWGTNTISQTGVNLSGSSTTTTTFLANFSDPNSSSSNWDAATSSEAYLTEGDSGGPVFATLNGTPTLVGINLYNEAEYYTGQPAGDALFGDGMAFGDIGTYSSQIAQVISTPEPSTALLLIGGVSVLGMRVRRKRAALKS